MHDDGRESFIFLASMNDTDFSEVGSIRLDRNTYTSEEALRIYLTREGLQANLPPHWLIVHEGCVYALRVRVRAEVTFTFN